MELMHACRLCGCGESFRRSRSQSGRRHRPSALACTGWQQPGRSLVDWPNKTQATRTDPPDSNRAQTPLNHESGRRDPAAWGNHVTGRPPSVLAA